jgi:2-polyprenyl-6-methoxyphenol hydroxylase-like FAD-dependent oxidoreductase
MSRQRVGFATRREKQKLFGAGQFFENLDTAQDTFAFLLNSELRRVAILLPIGTGRVRAYLMYGSSRIDRLQGAGDVSRFIDESIKSSLPGRDYTAARAVGPLASFDMTETWVEHPYRNGVVLIGEAAGSNDPTWGQGLSITMRNVREFSERLRISDDWDLASHQYARARDAYFQMGLLVHGWHFNLMLGEGAEADRIRKRVLPLLATNQFECLIKASAIATCPAIRTLESASSARISIATQIELGRGPKTVNWITSVILLENGAAADGD